MICTGLFSSRKMDRPDFRSPNASATLYNLLGGNAGERRFRPIDREDVLDLFRFERVVDIDNPLRGLEQRSNLARYGKLPVIVGPVDLGHEYGLHGRARRHLHHFHIRAILPRDRLSSGANPLRDVMALRLSPLLCD